MFVQICGLQSLSVQLSLFNHCGVCKFCHSEMTRFFMGAFSELSRIFLHVSEAYVDDSYFRHPLVGQWRRCYNGKMGLTDMLALEGCQNPSTSSCICGVFGLTSLDQEFPGIPAKSSAVSTGRTPLEPRAGNRDGQAKQLLTLVIVRFVGFG